MSRFSERYRSFRAWKNAMPRESRYGMYIRFLHSIYPKQSLSELRDLRKVNVDLSHKHWNELKSLEKNGRILSIEVLRGARKGESLTKAAKRVGIRVPVVLVNLGGAIRKKGRRYIPRKEDKVEIEMVIYEKVVGRTTIITVSSKDRSLIGKYFSDVKKARESQDSAILQKYEGIIIIDANGVGHQLETNLDSVYDIERTIEDSESAPIY